MKEFIYKVQCNNCDFEGEEEDLVLCIEDKHGNRQEYHGENYDESKEELFKGCPNCFDDGCLGDFGGEDEQLRMFKEGIPYGKEI